MVSTIMSTPLDFSKPLWQFQYVENYRGGSAVIARIHHCIADGIALVRVLLSLTDDSPKGSPRARRTLRRRKPLGGGFWLPEVVNDAVSSVGRMTARMVDKTLETLGFRVRTDKETSCYRRADNCAYRIPDKYYTASSVPSRAF